MPRKITLLLLLPFKVASFSKFFRKAVSIDVRYVIFGRKFDASRWKKNRKKILHQNIVEEINSVFWALKFVIKN